MNERQESKSSVSKSEKSTNELWNWTARELAHGIRTKVISSREAVISCLNRIDQVNPKINAIVEVLAEEALHAASEADQAVSNGEDLGPLHGVPTATKINSHQAGHATTEGVVAFKDNIASHDSPPIANLRKAGAVFIGRTNVPSFSLRWFSNNDLHGRTLNPWDSSRTPGGSSGGSGAAVACGMVPIAHGNDIAGSIRYPAYACGVTGLRPTVGRIPSWAGSVDADQSLAVQMMSTQGPLARNVGDLRLALSAMSSIDPRDCIQSPVPLIGEPLKRPIRVGLLRDVGVIKLHSSVNQALDAAASYLNDAGYVVEEVELPLFAEAYKLWWLIVLEDIRGMMPMIEEFGDRGTRLNLQYVSEVSAEWWGEPSLEKFKRGYARRGTLIMQLQQFLEEYPLLLLPISAEQAFKQDEDIESIDSGRRLMAAQWPMSAIPVLGFPAISVPTSVIDGLPMGVQLLGRRFREDTLFDAAEVIEAHASISTPIDPKFG
ncbi:amidase family protein [Neobacillus sp. WH10]|uniref:amidase family protein n=1 Tax=Neobacillus sp. WH10 TaxID=3047873 RepID=UPI0024C11ADE|nr:amidase family protein [Neobacillus sp. WH10]WHY78573.1 amidase family protein [Neobacillus sp. WH10]